MPRKRTELSVGPKPGRAVGASKQKKVSATCPKCGHVQPEPPGAYSTVCKKCRAHFRLDEVPRPAATPPRKPAIEQSAVSASKQKKVSATCPKCGHEQPEAPGAYSTVCKKCRAHFRLDEVPRPAATPPRKPAIEQRRIHCFQCGTELDVPVAASSTMCKRCSSYVDLSDYQITQTVSKNFRTFGRLVIEEKGYLLNTDSRVADVVVKGRLIGKMVAERTLEIHPTATIRGSITAGRLVVREGTRFRWQEALRVGGAEIGGELVANLLSAGTVLLKSTARLFGDVQAANLVVENGAVFVGAARVGRFG